MKTRFFDIDPTFNVDTTVPIRKDISSGRFIWQTTTPDGAGTLQLTIVNEGRIQSCAWGPGAEWLTEQTPALLGNLDVVDDFEPPDQLRDQWRRHPFRIGRTDRIWDALVKGVFGQKVQTTKAARSRLLLAKKYGQKAPGPHAGWILPTPEQVASMSYSHFHPVGVERKRADALIRGARELVRHPTGSQSSATEFKTRFEQIRGIGPWTTNVATAAAFGDADAVPVGDYHIPNTVCWNLEREPRGTDERMLELLAPFEGHRYRVIRLAKSTSGAPKYGPRLSLTADGLHRGR